MELTALFRDSFKMHYCITGLNIEFATGMMESWRTVTPLWTRLQWFLQEGSLIRTFTVRISSLC